MSPFAVDVTWESCGCLTFIVDHGVNRLRILASDMLPPLDDMFSGFVALTQGERHARFRCWAEPSEFRWLITADDGFARVRLLVFPDLHERLPDDQGRLIMAADMPVRTLVTAFVTPLRARLDRVGEDAFPRTWRGLPFPVDHLRTLEEWLARK
ncbi:hypothetical protein [Amycolatopsis sp. NPDC059657]|uniref:hypothetical protein n=1 Tax=Amycolatopsis sp. NPDC059657 TaxID=3346899 RepID=UPI003672EC08